MGTCTHEGDEFMYTYVMKVLYCTCVTAVQPLQIEHSLLSDSFMYSWKADKRDCHSDERQMKEKNLKL